MDDKQLTFKSQTTDKPLATSKEGKKVRRKEDSNILDEKIEKSFTEFWEGYPKKRAGSKATALKAYKKVITENRATAKEINDGANKYGKSDEATKNNGQFAKGAAAWLNDDRWKNNYEPARDKNTQQKASYLDKVLNAGEIARIESRRHMDAESKAPWGGNRLGEDTGQPALAIGDNATMEGGDHHDGQSSIRYSPDGGGDSQ